MIKILPAWMPSPTRGRIPPDLPRFPSARVRPEEEEAAAAAPAPSAGGSRALRASRPQGLPPLPPRRSRGPGRLRATRSPAGRTLTRAGAVRDDHRSGAEVVSAPQRGANELGCERCAPAAEPPLRCARPPFPAPLANAGRARSRLEPSVARRLPQPFAAGSRPTAAQEGEA